MVMIKVDQQQKPALLQRFAAHGGYVPRVFFLAADGSLREDIHSGHPRYPYFFSSQSVGKLKAAMRKAIGE